MYVHQAIDHDEMMESLCVKCKNEVTSDDKCMRCGKVRTENDSFVNPNFNYEKFNDLAFGITKKNNDDEEVDTDLLEQVRGDDNIGKEKGRN